MQKLKGAIMNFNKNLIITYYIRALPLNPQALVWSELCFAKLPTAAASIFAVHKRLDLNFN